MMEDRRIYWIMLIKITANESLCILQIAKGSSNLLSVNETVV